MQLLFLNRWFSDETANALSWTLVHSLWQGVLAAVLAGIIIVTTRKSTAGLRYNLLSSVLVLFLITTIITFCKVNSQHSSISAVTGLTNSTEETSLLTITEGEIAQLPVTYIDSFTTWFNERAHYFILLWMIFFAVNCLKVFAGLAALNRLRNYKTHSVPVEWKMKLDSLRRSIGLQQSVILLQSELTKVPVAVGFFKPAIFVPLGLLTHLPADQVETILLHELAHIRRRDYLVNLLQRFTEAIFFFNPGLLWISSLIRQEREACCDDIVVANTSHQQSYLEALVSFQEYVLSAPAYAMGIGSRKNYLFNRVKRLLTRENKKLDIMEKVILIMGIFVLTAFTFIPQEQEKKEVSNKKLNSFVIVKQKPAASSALSTQFMSVKANKKKIKKPVITTAIIIDSTPPKTKIDYDQLQFPGISNNINDDGKTRTQTTTATDQNGKKYTFTKLNGKITSLTVDGNNIPENEFDDYNALVNKVEARTHGNKVKSQKEIEARRAELDKRSEQRRERMEEDKKRRQDDLKDRGKRVKENEERAEEARKSRKKEMEEDRRERDRERKEVDKERQERNEIKREKIERKEKIEKMEKPEKLEKKEKLEKVEKPEKREKKERVEKIETKEDKNSHIEIQHSKELTLENNFESKVDYKSDNDLNSNSIIWIS